MSWQEVRWREMAANMQRDRILEELRRQLERGALSAQFWDGLATPKDPIMGSEYDEASVATRSAIDQALQELDKLEKAL